MKLKETPVEAANINNFGRNSFVTHTTGLIERVKRMTNEELLKVLDMSEDEQSKWVDNNCELEGYRSIGSGFVPTESLADLAFRLRDEVVEDLGGLIWHKATVKVCGYMGKSSIWLKEYAKPIHWIIAALIAKEKSDD